MTDPLSTHDSAPEREPGAGLPPRILIMDDQPVSSLFAARALERAGMETLRVGDPDQFIPALTAFAPDLILMNVDLSGTSGIELLRHVGAHDQFAHLPWVLLSGSSGAPADLEALTRGGRADALTRPVWLARPARQDQLVSSVREQLRRARERRRHPSSLPPAPASETGLIAREPFLRRLDDLLGMAGGRDDWGLVCLETAGDPRILADPLIRCLRAAELGAPISARTLALLVRPDDAGDADLAGRVARLNADLRAALAGSGETPAAFGSGWCPLAAGGDDALALVSRIARAAHLARSRGQEQPLGRAGEPAASGIAPQPEPPPTALRDSHFVLLFEPIVDLTRAPAPRYEVKPRLLAADGELLPPAAYLALARQAGMAPQVDGWLLDAVLERLVAWRASGQSVQLFVHQTMDSAVARDWADRIRERFVQRDLLRMQPVIQLETADMDRQLDLAVERAHDLERLGILLCLNGIGNDPASKRVLARVPAAFVRIATRAIRQLSSMTLLSLVQAARNRGLRVIAAGVDTPETVARLFGAGADLLQGPFVHPPMGDMTFDFAASYNLELA